MPRICREPFIVINAVKQYVKMSFVAVQECPQCGAPVELKETDHLFQCPFCNVRSVLASGEPFRYVLPPKKCNGKVCFVPYHRFKGCVYSCYSQRIDFRIMDFTQLSAHFDFLPITLGLRPQAMKLRFASQGLTGSFLKSGSSMADVLDKFVSKTLHTKEKLIYRAYIGETTSKVYLPLSLENGFVVDAVTGKRISNTRINDTLFETHLDSDSGWQPLFLATLCPHCGWDLHGEKDSVVLTCPNCRSAWRISQKSLKKIPFIVAKGNGDSLYLPFWKVTATASNGGIESFADFIRITKQPRIVQRQWENKKMSYWVPAFKIRPKIFLRTATQLTIAQGDFEGDGPMPDIVHPVTMPLEEAIQSLTLVFANSATNKKDIFPLLPDLQFIEPDASLVYLPFLRTSHDLNFEHLPVSINKSALQYGRAL